METDIPGLFRVRFSQDGDYLAAKGPDSLRVWNVETRQVVASIGRSVDDETFAAGGRVLVAVVVTGNDYEIEFFDLAHPGRAPRHVAGRNGGGTLAVSPDGGLVATMDSGQARLFDPIKAEPIEPPLHGHLNPVYDVAFSPDGRRLISAASAREAVKLWDVRTRQEMLTLGGTGSILWAARWSADGDVILAGPPWQAWPAPSWEEIAAAEAKDRVELRQP